MTKSLPFLSYDSSFYKVTLHDMDFTYIGDYTFEITLYDQLGASKVYPIKLSIVESVTKEDSSTSDAQTEASEESVAEEFAEELISAQFDGSTPEDVIATATTTFKGVDLQYLL